MTDNSRQDNLSNFTDIFKNFNTNVKSFHNVYILIKNFKTFQDFKKHFNTLIDLLKYFYKPSKTMVS